MQDDPRYSQGAWKVGDRVVVNSEFASGAHINESGTVVAVDTGSIYPVVVQLDSIKLDRMSRAARLGHPAYDGELRAA